MYPQNRPEGQHIIYDSNRYSVPLGTYNTNPEVQMEIVGGNLRILTVFGNLLCEHRISTGRGLLVQNKSHLRDRTTALDELQDSLDKQLNYGATEFLQRIREEKSRYARDQFRLLQSLLDRFGTDSCWMPSPSVWIATSAAQIP